MYHRRMFLPVTYISQYAAIAVLSSHLCSSIDLFDGVGYSASFGCEETEQIKSHILAHSSTWITSVLLIVFVSVKMGIKEGMKRTAWFSSWLCSVSCTPRAEGDVRVERKRKYKLNVLALMHEPTISVNCYKAYEGFAINSVENTKKNQEKNLQENEKQKDQK